MVIDILILCSVKVIFCWMECCSRGDAQNFSIKVICFNVVF